MGLSPRNHLLFNAVYMLTYRIGLAIEWCIVKYRGKQIT